MSLDYVPIPENLRPKELRVQLADRMKWLTGYTDVFFSCLDEKLQSVNRRLEDIDRRSENCLKKIASLRDEKKAVTLYSHPKYPSQEIQIGNYYQSFVKNEQYNIDVQLEARFKKENIFTEKEIDSTHVPYDDNAEVKSQFYIYDKVENVRQISTSFILFLMILFFCRKIMYMKSCLWMRFPGVSYLV